LGELGLEKCAWGTSVEADMRKVHSTAEVGDDGFCVRGMGGGDVEGVDYGIASLRDGSDW